MDTKYDKNSSKFNPALLHKNVVGRLAKSIKFDNLTNVIYCALWEGNKNDMEMGKWILHIRKPMK